MEKKYKLLKKEIRPVNHPDYPAIGLLFGGKEDKAYYRIQALRDIPEHGVKLGDLGGLVSNASILSHEGSCWIGGNATVLGKVSIIEDAYVGETANIASPAKWFKKSSITIGGNARILGNSKVFIAKKIIPPYWHDPKIQTKIMDNVVINGNALLTNVKGVSGHSAISDNAKVLLGAIISGDSIVKNNAVLHQDVNIHNVTVQDDAEISGHEHFSDRIFDGSNVFNSAKPVKTTVTVTTPRTGSVISSATVSIGHNNVITDTNGDNKEGEDSHADAIEHYQDVKAQIEAYRTDIAKIIQYPLMTDQTNVYTSAMTIAMKKADRLFNASRFPKLEGAVSDLEVKFIAAESNAIKMASTMLSKDERKETMKARGLFNMASNEASTEHEKKMAFLQGFKTLEGILTVPDVAMDTFRVKVGLKELES